MSKTEHEIGIQSPENISMKPTDICETTRKSASEALLNAISPIWGTPFSEEQLRNLWLQELRKDKDLLPDGWYTSLPPKGPPNGIGILFGSDKDPKRIDYDSLRPPKNHPQSKIFFDKKTGLAYIYASPVDRETGIIGDFGMTIYAGDKPEIIRHIKKVFDINHQIAKEIKPGINVSDAYNKAVQIFQEEGLTNNVTSETDLAAINIGHSVPGTLAPFSEKELKVIQEDNWQKACSLISNRRVFFNGTDDYVFKEGDCFTIEPRLVNPLEPGLPMVSFHTIAKVTENETVLLQNFKDIFQATGMSYI